MIEAPVETGWYVYAVVDAPGARARRAVEPLAGVAGAGSLTLVGEGTLAAVVGPVPLDEFDEDGLPERLNDRAWLERAALAHEEVLERLAAETAVVPLRFGSVHRRLDGVEQLLRERGAALAEALEQVRGRVELGVKAWLAAETDGRDVPAPSGRAYLERLRDERRRAADRSRELAAVLAESHAQLAELAERAVVNPPQPRELTGRGMEMVLNAAYLVPAGDESLRRAVSALDAQHRARGLRFEVTGPWPPYNFVDVGGDR